MQRQNNGGFTLQWHITHRCNLRCEHCYQEDYTAFADRDALREVLDQYEAMLRACRFGGHINITGGEPLLHPDLFWLLEEARRRQMTTAVLTNGTLVGLQEARHMRASGVQYVQISLDGVPQTHDAIRGKGSFDEAVRGVEALQSQGIFTSISFTAQRHNMGELKALAKLCERFGTDRLWFDRVVIPAGEDSEHLSLTTKEFQKLCQTAARLNRRGKVFCGRALQFLSCNEKLIYRCTAGTSLLALLADGTVMPCRRLPLIAGNVRESDLLTIYRDSPVLRDLRQGGIPAGCRSCFYADMCGGGAKCITYAQTGRYDLPDPNCTFHKI